MCFDVNILALVSGQHYGAVSQKPKPSGLFLWFLGEAQLGETSSDIHFMLHKYVVEYG